MAYREQWIDEIPDGPPPELMPEFADAIERATEDLGRRGRERLLDSFRWSLAVSRERETLRAIEARMPFLDHLMFGFLDPNVDGTEGPGLIAEVGLFRFADGEVPPGLPRELEPVSVLAGTDYEIELPVVIRYAQHLLDGPSLAEPLPASTALWAEMPFVAQTVDGWVLPRHSVAHVLAMTDLLEYADGSIGEVVADFGHCIDACLGSSSLPPLGLTPTSAMQSPTNGQILDFEGTTAPVVGVDVNLGLIRYSKAPIRITYEWPIAAAGDSGTLGRDASSDEPVVMHQGTAYLFDSAGVPLVDSDTGVQARYAFGLCLYQLEAMKALELFS